MISVIIPTYNRSSLLDKTLNSIVAQNLESNAFEVIVVDNGSTDNTRNVIDHYDQHLNIRYVFEKMPGLHSGRHRGLREAKGDILVYADDDIEALDTWLDGIRASFSDPHVGLVGGKNIGNYEVEPPAWLNNFWVTVPEGKYITYFSLLDFGEDTITVDPHYVFGCNFAVRKSIVIDARGFHPDGMPQSELKYRGDGETYVANHVVRMGYKAIYNPKASVLHWVPASRMNMDYLVKRSFMEGITQSYSDTRKKRFEPHASAPGIKMLSRIKQVIKFMLSTADEKKIRTSFLQGYSFHQHEMKKDPNLLNWVLRDSYL